MEFTRTTLKATGFTAVIVSILFTLAVKAQVKSITYQESPDDFSNPERGFYLPAGEAPGELSGATLLKIRTTHSVKSRNAAYAAWVSLLYRDYLLSDFKNSAISDEYLEKIDRDFAAVREAGMKVVLRFAYTNKANTGNCGDENKICPPYGDAPKHIVLQHIAQLKPILVKNADVISVLQQGFIGIWGENHYTDYFGTSSANKAGVIPDSSWLDRNEVLKALLDALPKDRMVQVRTPQFKQRYVYGPKAPVTSAPLTAGEAFKLTDKARIALHNDCFLASSDDYGTFYDQGNSSSPSGPANAVLRRFFEADSRYVAVGGETCDDAFSPENDCAPLGHAEQEMAAMHYSFLNTAYNNQVNNDWEANGCMMNIKRRLGYRFVLNRALLPEKVKAGGDFNIKLYLKNAGFASPYNPRPLELILRSVKSGKIYSFTLLKSVRKWYPGQVELNGRIDLPGNLSKGDYQVLLNLPDGYPSLAGRPEYSIRLANNNVWEEKTGFNRLNHVVHVY